MGWVWLDLDLINHIRQACPNLPFTEAIALILESRVAGGEEAHCRANLRRMLGGEIEVPCKAGKIDLLTPCGKLIEDPVASPRSCRSDRARVGAVPGRRRLSLNRPGLSSYHRVLVPPGGTGQR